MAEKIRLNWNRRERLIRHAKDFVEGLFPTDEIDALRNKLAPKVRECVEKRYPPKDMAVLKKYRVARAELQCLLDAGSGRVVRFMFADSDAPLQPTEPYRIIYSAPKPLVRQVDQLSDKIKDRADAVKARHQDYKILIKNSRTFEDVAKVWPQAEDVRAELQDNLPSPVTDAVVSRIRADAKKAA